MNKYQKAKEDLQYILRTQQESCDRSVFVLIALCLKNEGQLSRSQQYLSHAIRKVH